MNAREGLAIRGVVLGLMLVSPFWVGVAVVTIGACTR